MVSVLPVLFCPLKPPATEYQPGRGTVIVVPEIVKPPLLATWVNVALPVPPPPDSVGSVIVACAYHALIGGPIELVGHQRVYPSPLWPSTDVGLPDWLAVGMYTALAWIWPEASRCTSVLAAMGTP